MALISTLEPDSKERTKVHGPTRCLYTIFKDAKGRTYLQLDTYGSEKRIHTEKVSQSLQFNEAAVKELRKILDEAFPDS